MEVWQKIEIVPELEVSNTGVVRELATKKIRKIYQNKDGYQLISFKSKMYSVHRLVAITFIPNPLLLRDVNHKNKIKTDNTTNNLEWLSHSDNVRHSYQTIHKKELRKLSYSDVFQIYEMLRCGFSHEKVAACFDVSVVSVYKIANGTRRSLIDII